MTPSETTTTAITDRARLAVLPRSFKDVLLLTEAEKDNQEILNIMQELSQAAGDPESHFAIMAGERYRTYLVKVQGSQDPILIHFAGSTLGNRINGLRHGVKKSFVFQRLKESATAF